MTAAGEGVECNVARHWLADGDEGDLSLPQLRLQGYSL
jgi:hypothetical protein